MPVTIEHRPDGSLVRLEGAVNVTAAGELKRLLLEGLASGSDLLVDLERTDEIDITVLQLLWAAGREAGRTGARMVSLVSEPVAAVARDAGFERFPGTGVQE